MLTAEQNELLTRIGPGTPARNRSLSRQNYNLLPLRVQVAFGLGRLRPEPLIFG